MTEFKGVYLEPKRVVEMDAQGLKTECESKIIYNPRGAREVERQQDTSHTEAHFTQAGIHIRCGCYETHISN